MRASMILFSKHSRVSRPRDVVSKLLELVCAQLATVGGNDGVLVAVVHDDWRLVVGIIDRDHVGELLGHQQPGREAHDTSQLSREGQAGE